MSFEEQLAAIHAHYTPQCVAASKENGEANIFEILGIENKEVLICRVLGDILNPYGKINGNNSEPLRLFFAHVLGTESLDGYDTASVALEEVIGGNRRVDIVIRLGGRVYPIEVKIDAGDQPYQLLDYYCHYFEGKGKYTHQPDGKVYYLTPTGRKPSSKSIQKGGRILKEEDYKLISFGRNILKWLEAIDVASLNTTARFILNEFQEVIRKMTAEHECRETLYRILGYTEESGFANNTYDELLLTIIDNHEHIKKTILQSYIRRHCKLDDAYVWSADITKEDTEKDSHCILKVLRDGKTVAWICVHENLYIVAEGLTENAETQRGGKGGWDTEGSGNKYCWRYLYYAGSKDVLRLRNIREYLSRTEDIAIGPALDDCR